MLSWCLNMTRGERKLTPSGVVTDTARQSRRTIDPFPLDSTGLLYHCLFTAAVVHHLQLVGRYDR